MGLALSRIAIVFASAFAATAASSAAWTGITVTDVTVNQALIRNTGGSTTITPISGSPGDSFSTLNSNATLTPLIVDYPMDLNGKLGLSSTLTSTGGTLSSMTYISGKAIGGPDPKSWTTTLNATLRFDVTDGSLLVTPNDAPFDWYGTGSFTFRNLATGQTLVVNDQWPSPGPGLSGNLPNPMPAGSYELVIDTQGGFQQQTMGGQGHLIVDLTVVPEPTTVAALAAGLGLLGRRGRRPGV